MTFHEKANDENQCDTPLCVYSHGQLVGQVVEQDIVTTAQLDLDTAVNQKCARADVCQMPETWESSNPRCVMQTRCQLKTVLRARG